MKLLIVYGTTEGQTRKIVQFMRDRLATSGHGVTVVEAIEPPADLNPHAYDAVMVSGSVHLGKYQTAVEEFARAHASVAGGYAVGVRVGVACGRGS